MSMVKRLTVSVILLAITAVFWIIPDPVQMIDEILVTLLAVGGIRKQLLQIK